MSNIAKRDDRPTGQKAGAIIVQRCASDPGLTTSLKGMLAPSRLAATVALSVAGNRNLEACSPQSIAQAAIAAALLNLSPDARLGEAYLVPYAGSATLIVGYRGLLKLAYRAGMKRCSAQIRYDGEPFEFLLGDNEGIRHQRTDDHGEMIGVYATCQNAAGQVDREYMTRAEVEAVRKRSKAANNGPWVTDYDEMARKAVMRRLLKRQPMELVAADQLAAIYGSGGDDDAIDATVLRALPPIPEEVMAEDMGQVPQPAPEALPEHRPAPPPPPAPRVPADLTTLRAITGSLADETVIAWLRQAKAMPVTRGLESVFPAVLESMASDPGKWKSDLEAWLTKP